MTGKLIYKEYSFTKNTHLQRVTKLSDSVPSHLSKIQVDPQLLLQRLIIASQCVDDMSAIFKYQLSSYPPSLFDSSLMLLEPQKPALADAIWG